MSTTTDGGECVVEGLKHLPSGATTARSLLLSVTAAESTVGSSSVVVAGVVAALTTWH